MLKLKKGSLYIRFVSFNSTKCPNLSDVCDWVTMTTMMKQVSDLGLEEKLCELSATVNNRPVTKKSCNDS